MEFRTDFITRMCPFCKNFEEDAIHLFFSCDKVLPLWWESLSWIEIVGPLPQNSRQHFLEHSSSRASSIRKKRWLS